MRRAAKVDGTQRSIVDALRRHGCEVLSLAAVANGCPDLLVYDRALTGQMVLMEVKNPAGRGTKLTDAQVKFHAQWPVVVVTTPDEALKVFGMKFWEEKGD